MGVGGRLLRAHIRPPGDAAVLQPMAQCPPPPPPRANHPSFRKRLLTADLCTRCMNSWQSPYSVFPSLLIDRGIVLPLLLSPKRMSTAALE